MTDATTHHREQLEISLTLDLRRDEGHDGAVLIRLVPPDGYATLTVTTHEMGILAEQFARIVSELATKRTST